MLIGCGTHFDSVPIEDEKLTQLCPRIAWARIDAQKSTVDQMLAMIEQCRRVTPLPMLPQVILNTHEMIEAVPLDVPIEWQNERDINLGETPRQDPLEYRRTLEQAYAITSRTGHTLVGGIIANPLIPADPIEALQWRIGNRSRGLTWLREMDFQSLPADIVFGMHRYERHNTFENAHPPFRSRDEEWDAIVATVGAGRRIWITEGPGYDVTQGADWNRTADNIRKELAHYASKGVERYGWYQIRDSKTDDHDFGLFDEQDQLKQVIFEALPLRTQESAMSDATFCISQSQSFAVGNGFATYYPKGQTDTILSVQPDGKKETRPKAAVGAWETWKPSDDGQRAVFYETAEVYAYPLVP